MDFTVLSEKVQINFEIYLLMGAIKVKHWQKFKLVNNCFNSKERAMAAENN